MLFTVSVTEGFKQNGTPWTMRGLNATVQDALVGFGNVFKQFPGLNTIRLVVRQDASSQPSAIAQVVQQYTAAGVTVIIEDHSGNENNVAWYRQMAQMFKGNERVFLETPNEPHAAMATTIQNQINIINAIRAEGFTNPIGLQPWGGYDSSNLDAVTAAVGKANLFSSPHIYYSGTDPNGARGWTQTAIAQAKSHGLFPAIDEFGDAINGFTHDPRGFDVINAVIEANNAGQAGAVFWAMDNGNHADGADSAFLKPDGSVLTSIGQMLKPWLSQAGGGVPPEEIPVPTTPVITGSGSDSLTIGISETAYQGNALFTVSVDGAQQGGIFTATATHGTASQDFTFKGDWAPGNHTVSVNFLNDAWGGTSATDRNLYVDRVVYNGVDLGKTLGFAQQGAQSFVVTDTTVVGPPPPPVDPPTPDGIVIGSGSDALKLSISEDAYLGDAKFTVSIDGAQIGGIFTAIALHSAGAKQDFTFKGDFAPGNHTVRVNFLNDAWAGTPTTDRNLYVDKVSYNGVDLGKSLTMLSQGVQSFTVADNTPIGSGTIPPHQLLLVLSEDAYQGDAKFIARIDGQKIGEGTVTALERQGDSQDFAFSGAWAAGKHNVSVEFTNDLWKGTPSTDRNLYVEDIKYDGVSALDHQVAMFSAGVKTFVVGE